MSASDPQPAAVGGLTPYETFREVTCLADPTSRDSGFRNFQPGTKFILKADVDDAVARLIAERADEQAIYEEVHRQLRAEVTRLREDLRIETAAHSLAQDEIDRLRDSRELLRSGLTDTQDALDRATERVDNLEERLRQTFERSSSGY